MKKRRFREAACRAHLRRDFHDIRGVGKSEIAREALGRIGSLYDIERRITGQSAQTRQAARQTHSKPIVENFKTWSEAQLTRIPGKGDLAKAFRYGLSRISDAPDIIAQTLPVRLTRLPGGVIVIREK